MAVDAAALAKAMKDLMAELTETLLDNQRVLLADMETKYNNLSAQLQLLLNRADTGGSADKKPPKRVVAVATENTTESTAKYPNLAGLSEANVKAINSLQNRGTRNTYLKKRCAVDVPFYNTIPEDFRTEHENSSKAEKAKKSGDEALREFVAAQWWDKNKTDKDFLASVKKEMDEWVEFMHATNSVSTPSAAMENE
jgi:hypothetical protein